MGKPTICIGENKGADQLRSNCQADQHLCFHYTDSTIPRLLKSEISSFLPSFVTVQPGLYGTWSETQIVGFLIFRLIYFAFVFMFIFTGSHFFKLIHIFEPYMFDQLCYI